MTPYLFAFAITCVILCYGLMRRPVWMWYLGWLFFYLFSGYFCMLFFGALYESPSHRDVMFSFIYLAGGLSIWLPTILWWIRIRPRFIAKY